MSVGCSTDIGTRLAVPWWFGYRGGVLRVADPTRAAVAQEAMWLAIRFRHAGWLLLAAVHLASRPDDPRPEVAAIVLLAVWSAGRLQGGQAGRWWTVADLVVVSGYLLCTLSLVPSAAAAKDLVEVKIVAATVISFGIAQRVRVSAAVVALMLGLLYLVDRQTPGLTPVMFLGDLSVAYLLVEWLLAVGVRRAVLRAAAVHDTTVTAAADSRIAAEVTAARRRYEHEQWAVTHDTAAATLLMVGQGAAADPERIARQAARDLTVLEAGIPMPGDGTRVDLPELLRRLAGECATPITFEGVASLPTPRGLAWAITAAAREALTNVDRHAHARAVVVTAAPGELVIADDGVGFEGAPGEERYGIRNSIVARMRAAGGDADVVSTPGAGTDVRLSWPVEVVAAPAAELEPEEARDATAGVERLGNSFGYGMVGVAVADTLLQSTLTESAATPSTLVDALLVAVNVGCALAALIPRRRERTTLALMAAAILGSLALTALLPADAVVGGANWSIGAAGWTVVALGFRWRPLLSLSALSTWWVLVCAIVLVRSPSGDSLVVLGYLTAAIFFLQVFTALFAATLDRVARDAAAHHRERLRHRTADAVERTIELECRLRYEQLLTELTPLLRGLADRTLSPEDPAVRTAARTEYARLRRLLTQADGVGHPLLADLRAGIDEAERRGVAVTVEAAPTERELPDEVRGHLVAATRMMLDASLSRARVVVTADAAGCTVSALGDCPPETMDRLALITGATVDTEVLTAGELLWARLHHRFDTLERA
ncbi:sensor histidine kinase [Nocardia sp. NPDC020380]|uniref:sensor histidine kinase n=1 Tax=Nocardia sp. NPDC020380 TaxID=3364309 RepID=UPI00379F1F37